MKYQLRPYQEEAVHAGVNFFRDNNPDNGIIVAPTGCHAKGYKILMADGSLKAVEKIKVGEQVMGDDGTPRNVLYLPHGHETMYRIVPEKGEPFVVNENHKLSLRHCRDKEDYIEVKVKDYIQRRYKDLFYYQLWRPSGINFGRTKRVSYFAEGQRCDDGLFAHLPEGILVSSVYSRCSFLFGLLHRHTSYGVAGYIYRSKHKRMCEDIQFIARSLGVTVSRVMADMESFYLNINVSLENIEAVLSGKKRDLGCNTQLSSFEVEYAGEDEFFGLTLGGNHLYIDEQFFVQRNSGKSLIISELANRLGGNVLVFQPSKEIVAQNLAKMKTYTDDCSAYSASVGQKKISKITFATIGSVKEKWSEFQHFDYILIDECFTGDTEILTEKGFQRFDSLDKSLRVAQFDKGAISFVNPIRYIERDHDGDMCYLKVRNNVTIPMTPNHELLTYHFRSKEWAKFPVKDAPLRQGYYIPLSCECTEGSDELTDLERLYIAFQADGSFHRVNRHKTRALFSFHKKRKIERFKMLCDRAGINYVEVRDKADTRRTRFIADLPVGTTKFIWKHIKFPMTANKARQVLEECAKWDGTLLDKGMLYFSSVDKSNVNFYQAVAAISGWSSYMSKEEDNRVYYYRDVHRLYINPKKQSKSMTHLERSFAPYKGKVYCVEVPSHNIVIRHNGYVMAIGNCHGVNGSNEDTMYLSFLSMMKCKVLGLTATPYRLTSERYWDATVDNGLNPETGLPNKKGGMRTKNAKLTMLINEETPFFKRIIYLIQIGDMVKNGYLAQLRYFDVKPPRWNDDKIFKNSTGCEFSEKSVKWMSENSDLTGHIINICRRLLHPKDGKPRNGILVFVTSIEEAETVARNVAYADFVTGKTTKKNRERILQEFRDGKIKVLVNVGVLTCLPEDTEILTREGWVGIDDISYEHHVAQYEDEQITFANPLRIIKKDYDGDFVGVDNRYITTLMTADHNVLYKTYPQGLWHKDKAIDIVDKKIYIPTTGYAQADAVQVEQPIYKMTDQKFIISHSYLLRKKGFSKQEALNEATRLLEIKNSRKYKQPNELSLDECTFIGFWLGDGCVYKDNDGSFRYSVSQSLSTPKMCEWIETLMSKIGIHYTISQYEGKLGISNDKLITCSASRTYNLPKGTGGHTQHVNTNLFSLIPYLVKDGTELYWGLSREQYYALIVGYAMANGQHGNCELINTSSIGCGNKRLADILQAVGVCRGYQVNISVDKSGLYKSFFCYINVTDMRYHYLMRQRLQVVPNAETKRVWCVTMPKGTIVTRRNGRTMVLGNCGFDYPALDTIVLGRPTLSLAWHYQALGRAIRKFDGKDAWIIDCVGNTGRFGDVANLYIGMSTEGTVETFGYVYNKYRRMCEWKQLTGVVLNPEPPKQTRIRLK